MTHQTAQQDRMTSRTGIDGPHQFAEALLAGILVAIKELTQVIQMLSEKGAENQTGAAISSRRR